MTKENKLVQCVSQQSSTFSLNNYLTFLEDFWSMSAVFVLHMDENSRDPKSTQEVVSVKPFHVLSLKYLGSSLYFTNSSLSTVATHLWSKYF